MMHVMRLVVLALALGALVAATTAQAHPLFEFKTFQTPSRAIHCGYSAPPASLRCDVDGGLKPKPKRPASCELDWAGGLNLGKTGRASVVCAGDTVDDPDARVVGYGKTWRRGGIECVVKRAGTTCENTSGHGFFLSRTSWRKF
jgi:hypothetical protein